MALTHVAKEHLDETAALLSDVSRILKSRNVTLNDIGLAIEALQTIEDGLRFELYTGKFITIDE